MHDDRLSRVYVRDGSSVDFYAGMILNVPRTYVFLYAMKRVGFSSFQLLTSPVSMLYILDHLPSDS